MKKLFYLLLVAGLGLTVAACGTTTTAPTTTTTTTTSQTTTTTTSQTTTTTTTESSDKIAPMIVLKSESVEVMKGEQVFDAEANIDDAFDETDATVSKETVQIDMGGYEGIDTEEGVYTVTYTVSDAAGNKATKTCVVTVVAVEPSIVFKGTDGTEYTWPMNFNPVLGAQYTQGYGIETWAYELDKVTVLSKAYFEYLEANVYERISASWSFVMVTNSDLEVVYVRDHYTNEFYLEDGVVVSAQGKNWCTGTATGINDAYCDVTKGRQMANLTGEGAHDYAKIPDGGYVIIFINNGANTGYDCPRGFGERIYGADASTGGVGQKLQFIGAGKEFGATNAPAYVKTTEKAVVAYYGTELDIMDGISYVSYNNSNLTVSTELFPVSGGVADLNNELLEIDTTAPAAGANGLVPETQYIVRYTVEENGRKDTLVRHYTLKEDSSTVSAYQEVFTLGSLSTLVYLNDEDGLVPHDSGLGMVIHNNDRPHLYDIATAKAILQAQKDAGVAQVVYQFGAYFILDKDLKVVQFVFAIGTDKVYSLSAEGEWTFTALETGSKHNLLNDFLGETPLVDYSKAAFVLFTQNTSANNATVRQFGVNLWNTQGVFKDDPNTPDVVEGQFDQQELFKSSAVITREGINTAGKVLETKDYVVTSALAGPDGKVYEMSYNHGWYWAGGEPGDKGNTWLRFSPEMLHLASKEFTNQFAELNVYLPWASMLILDENLKVVALRAFYEDNVNSIKQLIYVTKDVDGNVVVTPADETEWNSTNCYDSTENITSLIPDGGYVIPLITAGKITIPVLQGILGDVTNPVLNDYQFTMVYQLALAE